MSWTHLTLVTDAELGQLEPEAVDNGSPWGATTWANARTEAKRDLKVWIEADYSAQIPHPADKVLDRQAPNYVFGETSSVFTEYTTEATDTTEEDIDLSVVLATAGTDGVYIGSDYEFDGLYVSLLDSVNATASTLTASYWAGGSGWTSLSATDGTASGGATFAKSGRVTWSIPSAWERRDVNDTGALWFWVKLTVSASPDADTAANQILPIRAPDGLKRVAAYLALYHILNGLDLQAGAGRGDWAEKAREYWMKAQELYDRLKAKGGIPIDWDVSGSVEVPSETTDLAGIGGARLYRG